jgi:hypothetical protein
MRRVPLCIPVGTCIPGTGYNREYDRTCRRIHADEKPAPGKESFFRFLFFYGYRVFIYQLPVTAPG